MIPFIKTNKNFAIYTLIFLIVLPVFGFNFLISFIGNILLLILLVPLLLLIIALISFNSFKTKVKICNNCGTINFGVTNICSNCSSDLGDTNIKNYDQPRNPSDTTIEVKAEEIK